MKSRHLAFAIISLISIACGNDHKSKNPAPTPTATPTPSPEEKAKQKEEAKLAAAEKHRNREQLFSRKENQAIADGLIQYGCKISVANGLKDCPSPETIEQADQAFDLIMAFRSALTTDAATKADTPDAIQKMNTTATDFYNTLDKSAGGVAALARLTEIRRSFFLNRSLSTGYEFNYSTRIQGLNLVKELSENADFVTEINRLPGFYLTLGKTNALVYNTTVQIMPKSTIEDVLTFVKGIPSPKAELTAIEALKNQVFLDRTLVVDSKLTEEQQKQGLQLLIKLRENVEFNELVKTMNFTSYYVTNSNGLTLAGLSLRNSLGVKFNATPENVVEMIKLLNRLEELK